MLLRLAQLLLLLGTLLALGCDGSPTQTGSEPVAARDDAAEVASERTLEAASPAHDAAGLEHHESTDRYEYRIRWAASLAENKDVEAAVRALADDHLQEFLAAAAAAPATAGRWTLQLEFAPCAGTPTLRCIAGDGSVFSGGAHPLPIIERLLFATSPPRPLRPEQLFSDPDAALRAISVRAREMLLVQRIAQASVSGSPADAGARAEMRAQIASGADSTAENYRLAEPVVSSAGRINALRFLFAPYQVASYADGTLVAEVPASVFAQWLLPEFADEFVTR